MYKYIYENIDEVPDNEKIELINYAVSRGRLDCLIFLFEVYDKIITIEFLAILVKSSIKNKLYNFPKSGVVRYDECITYLENFKI